MSTTHTTSFERVQRLLGHVDGISAPNGLPPLASNATASTTGVFGPSDRTFAFLQKITANLGRGGRHSSSSSASSSAAHSPKQQKKSSPTPIASGGEAEHDDTEFSLHDDAATYERRGRKSLSKKGGPVTLDFDIPTMTRTLDVWFLDEKQAILKQIGTLPSFQHFHSIGQTMPEMREITHQQVKDFVKYVPSYQFSDVKNNPLKWISHLEMLYYHGCTVATKAGVHFGLFGATVMNLGSDAHRAYFGPRVQDLSVRGAFCLTELGHGSNARDIETLATYDHRTREFVLNTPTELAQKIYIGNLALHANWAVVFAQLIVGTQHVGVHAFVVQIRNEDSTQLMPNVRILDCGPKAGLGGVDNGRLWLDNLRVPATALLNKFGDVDPATGKYTSPIASPLRRFTATIGQLVGGRIIVGQGAVHASKVGLAIAVKYAHSRCQFGPPDQAEQPIMNFLSHRLRLMPLLARTYALQFAMNRMKTMYASMSAATGADREDINKELHVLAAGLKPIATWHKNEALQTCRECCGGMGFLAVNRIAPLRNDSDIDMTWEGDNTVLLQQVSASLLKEFKEQFQGDHEPAAPNPTSAAQAKFRGALKYLESEAAFSWQTARANPMAQQHRAAGKKQLQRDLDFYLAAFRFREGRLLRALVNRLGSKPKSDAAINSTPSVAPTTSGPNTAASSAAAASSSRPPSKGQKPSQFDAWNQAGDLVLELARAHVDRQLIEAFVAEIDRLDSAAATDAEASLVPVLRTLCSLFALTTIQKHMGFYLTFRFFSVATSKAVWDTINTLCNKLAPASLALVDGFGLPDSVLAAPIAGDWKAAYAYPNIPGYVPIDPAHRPTVTYASSSNSSTATPQ